MHTFQHAYFSNRIEHLYEKLKKDLFFQSHPFAKRLIIVPSPPLKSWLNLTLASDPELNVAAGIQVVYLEESIERLSLNYKKKIIPSALELAFAIEWEVTRISSFPSCQPEWKDLLDYLDIEPGGSLSKKSAKRLNALAGTLADLFVNYGKYGGTLLDEWQHHPKGWQELLWKKIFLDSNNSWDYLYSILDSNTGQINDSHNTSVYLFSFSFIPKIIYKFLEKVAEIHPVYNYILSPCQVFWSDTLSERESQYMQRFWKEQGISIKQQTELENYLKECNPLLANFGRLGREMAIQVEESHAHSLDCYSLPISILQHSCYEPLIDEQMLLEKRNTFTMLDALQADMLLLRNPEHSKVSFGSYDNSIQIHGCPTRFREVQTLHDLLLGIINTHSRDEVPLAPSDILVMAPDIILYEPYIKSIFVQGENNLEASMMDLRVPSQSPLIQSFCELLNIPLGRWDSESILRLFSSKHFQNKHALTSDDYAAIQEWVQESNIRWGIDVQHRDDILIKNHCSNGMVDKSSACTWEHGLERLLAGLVLSSTHDQENFEIIPIKEVDFSQGELLGRFIEILKTLNKTLDPLASNAQLTLPEWTDYLRLLLEGFFDFKPEEGIDLLKNIEKLRKCSTLDPSASFAFLSIKDRFESLLSKQTASYRESALQAVRFCSLLPMRTIPAKVIVLLGMNEGVFPRQEPMTSLNLLRGNEKADYAPSQTDFDRYLFLEALLSARMYFIMSYNNYSQEDSKDQWPSLLISELLNYLDKTFLIDSQKPSSFCFNQHPFCSYDKSFFEEHGSFPSYSISRYEEACAYYFKEKKPPHRFIESFSINQTKVPDEIHIDLNSLQRLANNPIQSYFNQLGMFLKDRGQKKIELEERLQISALDKAKILKEGLKIPFEKVLNHSDQSGKLPFGLFKELDVYSINQELVQRKKVLVENGIFPEELFTIELSEKYDTLTQVSQSLIGVPPLEIEVNTQSQAYIHGIIPDVSTKGMIINQECKAKEIVKNWPVYLVLHALIHKYSLSIDPNLIFIVGGKIKTAFFKDPYPYLKKYIEYFCLASENPSPLLTDWLPDLMQKEVSEQEISERWIETMKDPFKKNYNNYLKWLIRQETLPEIENHKRNWSELASELFLDPFTEWGVKK